MHPGAKGLFLMFFSVGIVDLVVVVVVVVVVFVCCCFLVSFYRYISFKIENAHFGFNF